MSYFMKGGSGSKSSSTSNLSPCGKHGSKAVYCHHGMEAPIRSVKNGPNAGRKFYGCALWPNADCGKFVWFDGLNEEEACCEMADLQKIVVEKEKIIFQLEAELKGKNDKISKLKMKKADNCLQIQELRMELTKSQRGEKNLFFVLVMSWVLIAFIWVFVK